MGFTSLIGTQLSTPGNVVPGLLPRLAALSLPVNATLEAYEVTQVIVSAGRATSGDVDSMSTKPGNAMRLVAVFAQPAPPTNNPNQPTSQTLVLPNGKVLTIFGTLFNPPGPLVVILHGADGSKTTLPAPIQADLGVFYVDALIPQNAWPGTWNHRWYQQGVAIEANFLKEDDFFVEALDF